MTASIQEKGTNYYIVLAWKDNGKNHTKWLKTGISVKGDNKRAVEKRRKEILSEYEAQRIDLSRDVLFDVFLDNWLANLKHSVQPTTYDTYQRIVESRILPFFKPLGLRVKDVTPAHIQAFVKHSLHNVSANTVHRYLANISKCLNSAVKQNLIAFNPVARIDKPKKTKHTDAKHYNEQQINELLERSKGDTLEIVILLTLFYGLRRSEVLGLMWGAVDFIDNTITIKHTVVPGKKTLHKKDTTKNDSSNATLPMSDIIKERLLKWREHQEENKRLQPNDYADTDYICTGVNGELLSPDFVSAHFRLLLKKIGMPHIRFHDLRHSAACYLFSLGYNLKDIQAWLRHKDIQTTANMYLKHDMSARREIADSISERLRIAVR